MNLGRRALVVAPCCLLLACGGSSGGSATPTSDPVDLPSTTVTGEPATLANDAVSVALVERPEQYAFDGAVTEWELTATDFGPGVEISIESPPDEEREQEPVPTDPVGRVALSVTNDGVLVAGELSKAAGDAVWVGIGTRPARLPYIGGLGRASASFDPVLCTEMERDFTDGMYIETDRPTPPETLAACKAVVARYDAFAAERNARFSRVFRFDAKGVTEVTGGKSAAVANAKILWRTGAERNKTFEATLGNESMPRVADAPLLTMRVLARSRELKVPAVRWTATPLMAPVAYEPHGNLRAELFMQLPQFSIPYQPPPGLSFHPTKPNLIESYEHGMDSISPSEGPLFVEQAVIGDVKIGKVDIGRSFLATYKGAEFVELREPLRGWGPTTTSGPISRNGTHHLFHYADRVYMGGMSFEPPGWTVTTIDQDGRFNEIFPFGMDMPPQPASGGMWWGFNDPKPLSNKDFSEFGYRGVARENDGEQEVSIKWRWDAKTKEYVMGDWKMGPQRPRK